MWRETRFGTCELLITFVFFKCTQWGEWGELEKTYELQHLDESEDDPDESEDSEECENSAEESEDDPMESEDDPVESEELEDSEDHELQELADLDKNWEQWGRRRCRKQKLTRANWVR